MWGISLIICCYNSASTIEETLRHIQRQDTIEQDNWEVLLINNNSQDNTEQIAINTWPSDFSPHLRIISEPRPGLTNARLRGVNEARFDLISYIDDDNLVPPNWVSYMLKAFQNPEVGVLGSTVKGKFDIKEPSWYKKEEHQLAFATGRLYKGADFIDITHDALLFGAGLTMRKSIFEKLKQKNWTPLLSDRKGTAQSSGGDSELTLASRLLGYRVFFTNQICLTHWIINNRLSWQRLEKVTEGFGQADVFLLPYNYHYRKAIGKLSLSYSLRRFWWFNYLGKTTQLLKWWLVAKLDLKDKNDAKIIFIRLNAFRKTILNEKDRFRQTFASVEKLIKH